MFPPICAHCGREFSGKIVLETGTRLAPAIKLYEAMRYARIPLFGEYLSSPATSLYYGKSLA